MPRTTLLSTIALAAACTLGGSSLGAQSITSTAATFESQVPTDTTTGVRMLPAQRVVAKQPKASREGVLALMEENRRLAAELRRQDQKVETLTRRLAHLRGPVTDGMNRDIARLDAEAAETRARRLELEARLNAIEGGGALVAP
jgi:predicted RNase H-like nuclease (RuvC/YqgF family)